MTVLIPENIVAAQKAHLDAWFGLTRQAFEGAEKILQLNLHVMKSAIDETQERAQQALSVQDAREMLGLQTATTQPLVEKSAAYGRELYQIASQTHAGFSRAFEEQAQAQNERTQQMVDNFARNAPAGSETAVAAVKTAINAGNAAYETARKATQQAVEMAESNMNAVANAAVQTAQASAAAA